MVKRILVIDDDDAIRKAFLLALEDTGFQVDTASSGLAGLELIKMQPYDLIYLDLKMPGLNGVETLKQLRKINSDVPVYIITAFYGEFSQELIEAQEEGLDFELMLKPLSMDQIINLTRSLLEGVGNY